MFCQNSNVRITCAVFSKLGLCKILLAPERHLLTSNFITPKVRNGRLNQDSNCSPSLLKAVCPAKRAPHQTNGAVDSTRRILNSSTNSSWPGDLSYSCGKANALCKMYTVPQNDIIQKKLCLLSFFNTKSK